MSNYLGVRCPVCNKKFTEADDIVVCPICGAPHHRDCYMDAGHCVFVEDHLSGKEWTDPAAQVTPSEPTPDGLKVCSRCGSSNPPEQIFCQVCGNPLSVQQPNSSGSTATWGPPVYGQPNTISMAYGGLPPESEIDGETVRDLAQYIGSGSAYFLPRFQLMGEGRRIIAPNFAAFFFSFFYFFYRKMYVIGAILLAISIVGTIPYFLYMKEVLPDYFASFGITGLGSVDLVQAEHFRQLNNIAQTIILIIRAVTAFMANRFYYNQVLASVNKIRTNRGSLSEPQYGALLAQRGGTSKIAVVIVLCVVFAISMSVSFLIIPANLP